MITTIFIVLLIIAAAYAWRQRQRRAWTEGLLVGTTSVAKFANTVFQVQWVRGGDELDAELADDVSPKQVIAGLVHPNRVDIHPVLIVDSGHPSFDVCLGLAKGNEVLITFNPNGWRWGDETVCPQTNWTRHVFVAKKN